MEVELSRRMISAIEHMSRNNNKLVRFPGGYWAREGWHSWNGPNFGTPTVEAIVRRGYAEYTVWKDGRGGRFPIECSLTQRALDWLSETAKITADMEWRERYEKQLIECGYLRQDAHESADAADNPDNEDPEGAANDEASYAAYE